MENTMESTKSKFCYRWGIVESKAPVIFNDFSICSEECTNYSKEFGTCLDFAYKTIKTRLMLKDGLK